MAQLVVPANLASFPACSAFIETELKDMGITQPDMIKILAASEEILVNIMNYAYPNQTGFVSIKVKIADRLVVLDFIDQGIPFNPLEQTPGDLARSAEDRPIGGLGILLVKQLMDDVHYERRGIDNRLTIARRV